MQTTRTQSLANTAGYHNQAIWIGTREYPSDITP